MKWILSLILCVPAFGQDFASVAVVGNLFHPREIAGIHAMWDASTINAAPGTTITNWPTSVGFYTASNGVTSKAPLMQRTQYSGRNALEFDGVDDWMASEPISLNVGITYFGVVRYLSSTNIGWMFEHGPNANFNPGMFISLDNSGGWLVYRSGSYHYNAIYKSNSIPNITAFSYQYITSGLLWSNSVPVVFQGTGIGSTRPNTFATDKIYFASRAGSSFFGKLQYSEHIFYTNILSNLDRRKVSEYLASKYSIPSSYRGL